MKCSLGICNFLEEICSLQEIHLLLDHTIKRYPMSKDKGKAIGGAKLHLEYNPIPTRDAQRAQTKPCVHQNSETSPETEPELFLNVSCGGRGQQWPVSGAGALGTGDLVIQPVA